MGYTEKVSLSLEGGALVLARRAAQIEGVSLSVYVSRLLRRYAWESERPALDADAQARSDAELAELDEREFDGWGGAGGQRAAG